MAGGTVQFEGEGASLKIVLGGAWRIDDGLPSTRDAEARLADTRIRSLALEGSAVSEWDSSLLTFLVPIAARCRALGLDVDASRLPDGVGELIDLALAVPEKQGTGRGGERETLLVRIGNATADALSGSRETLAFVGEAVLSLGRFATGRARFRGRDLALFVQQAGADAVPIVTLISFLVGLILAFVGVQQLLMFGAEIYVANLVGIAMTREMACIMTGIIMAGRTGASYAAQLGTMMVNEEIDALQTLGVPPMDFLVLPRMLALILMMPLLVLYADAVGILGGGLIAASGSDLTWAQYWTQTRASVGLDQIAIGVAKGAVFGVLIAVAGCMRGMQSGRSAAAVGEAATSAVVLAIVWIIVMDAIFAVALDAMGI